MTDGKLKPTLEDGMRQIAQSCTRRLLELDLPERYALLARDSVIAHLENFHARFAQGEWEPR